MNNPIWQPAFASPMIYDFDVSPEGLAEQINYRFGDKQQFRVFGNFGQFPLNEISGDVHDIYMYDLQGGAEATLGPVKITLATGYYLTDHLNDLGSNASSTAASTKNKSPNVGNYVTTTTPASSKYYYPDDFGVWYGRADIVWTIREKRFLGTPTVLTVSGEWLENSVTAWNDGVPSYEKDQTSGYTFQAMFGGNKKQGEWSLTYQYKMLEANATWDAITDSDWGSGGTDRRGHVFAATYNIRDWWQCAFKTFLTSKISDTPNSDPNAVRGWKDEDLLRVQVDSSFKF